MIYEIRNIDDKSSLFFDARTPYEAMTQLIYYLTGGRNAENININKTESNRFLYSVFRGKTYATKLE